MGKITNLNESFEFTEAPKVEAINAFVNKSLWMVTQYHIWHLQTKDHSEHMAVGRFYENLNYLLDKVAENFIGANGNLTVVDGEPFTNYSKAKIKSTLQEFGELVSQTGGIVADKNSSKVIMDEIESLVASTLYKLGQE